MKNKKLFVITLVLTLVVLFLAIKNIFTGYSFSRAELTPGFEYDGNYQRSMAPMFIWFGIVVTVIEGFLLPFVFKMKKQRLIIAIVVSLVFLILFFLLNMFFEAARPIDIPI